MHTKINQIIKTIEDKLFSPGFKHKSFCWKYFVHVTWIYLTDTGTIAFVFLVSCSVALSEFCSEKTFSNIVLREIVIWQKGNKGSWQDSSSNNHGQESH